MSTNSTQTTPHQDGQGESGTATIERWIVFTHNKGGDMVTVQTDDVSVAERAFAALSGLTVLELFAEAVCCCGPAWTLTEHYDPDAPGVDDADFEWESAPDPSFPYRPEEDYLQMGPRYDGTPRARHIAAADVQTLLASYEAQHGDTDENRDTHDADVEGGHFSCC